MTDPHPDPLPKVPGRAKALLCLLGIVILAVGVYGLVVTGRKPSVDVAPPASGLTGDGTR